MAEENPIEYDVVMEDKVITNIAGWVEPNNDGPCDESAYRDRLEKNGPVFQKKTQKIFNLV